jgi:hypothetical protein
MKEGTERYEDMKHLVTESCPLISGMEWRCNQACKSRRHVFIEVSANKRVQTHPRCVRLANIFSPSLASVTSHQQ